MTRFMKKPEYVDAIQFDGKNVGEVLSFIACRELKPFEIPAGTGLVHPSFPQFGPYISLDDSGQTVKCGAWLVRREGDGSLIVFPDSHFSDNYLEIVDDPNGGESP